MKKLTTKLLMSIIAVAFAFVALGTSTYAWFSMNTTVTAQNMEITAKSDSTYLLIGTSETASVVQGANETTVTAVTTSTSTEVFPIAYNVSQKTIYLNGKTADNAEAADTQIIPASTWYTLSNRKTNNATNELTNYKAHQESDADFGSYVVVYTAYLCLSQDSTSAYTGKLNISFDLADNGSVTADNAVSAIVRVYSNTGTLVEASTPLQKGDANITANVSYQTDADITINNLATNKVEVLVYVDGNSVNVYSDYINGTNAHTITGKAVVSFGLED